MWQAIRKFFAARFPNEKFWDKDGNPIYPRPKGPPKGTVGRTHEDLGSQDGPDPRQRKKP